MNGINEDKGMKKVGSLFGMDIYINNSIKEGNINILKALFLDFNHNLLYEAAYKIFRTVGRKNNVLPIILTESRDKNFKYSYMINGEMDVATFSWKRLRNCLINGTLERIFEDNIKHLEKKVKNKE